MWVISKWAAAGEGALKLTVTAIAPGNRDNM
jgi:hypothetical protein